MFQRWNSSEWSFVIGVCPRNGWKIESRDMSDYFESKELTKGKGYEAILLWVSSRGSQLG